MPADDKQQHPGETSPADAEVRRLIAEFIDLDAPSDAEVAALERLLRTDDRALREYVELTDIDARLRWINRGGRHPLESDSPRAGETPTEIAPPSVARVAEASSSSVRDSDKPAVSPVARLLQTRSAQFALAASLLLAIGLGYRSVWRQDTIGALTEVAAVKWGAGSQELSKGSAIKKGTLALLSGVVEVTLHNDTRLIVEGPSQIDLRSEMEAYLDFGDASVFVGEGVDGFALESGDVRVVDLGTAFQMRVRPERGTEVHVVDGRVRATATSTNHDAEPIEAILTERDAARFGGRAVGMNEIEFNGDRINLFGRDAPLTAIPVAVTGAIRCLQTPPASVAYGDLEDSEMMHLFLERAQCELSAPIFADRNPNGEDSRRGGNRDLALPTRVPLNSYLLHYDPANEPGDYELRRVSGTITFREPIVGVFCTGVGLYTSDKVLCHEDTQYRTGGPSVLGRRALENLDFVSFSPDRKTVFINFHANTSADQLRIVTRSAAED